VLRGEIVPAPFFDEVEAARDACRAQAPTRSAARYASRDRGLHGTYGRSSIRDSVPRFFPSCRKPQSAINR
jgi:hypothetical protein